MPRGIQSRAAELPGSADMDMTDRRSLCRNKRPDADRIEAIYRGARQCEVAFVVTGLGVRARRGRFDQGDMAAGRIQRNGEARANQAAADDQHVAVSGKGRRGIHARNNTR